jgi:hypothetical protein
VRFVEAATAVAKPPFKKPRRLQRHIFNSPVRRFLQ